MNVPNALTTLRFFLIVVFVYVFYNPNIQNNLAWATGIFILAGFTDLLDGFIARRCNMVTKWGKLMDPLADKAMLITVLICLYDMKIIPIAVIIIVVLKELLMVLGAAFLYKNRKVVVQANYYGKAATVAFYLAVVALVFDIPHSEVILAIAVLATLLALVQYGVIQFKSENSDK